MTLRLPNSAGSADGKLYTRRFGRCLAVPANALPPATFTPEWGQPSLLVSRCHLTLRSLDNVITLFVAMPCPRLTASDVRTLTFLGPNAGVCQHCLACSSSRWQQVPCTVTQPLCQTRRTTLPHLLPVLSNGNSNQRISSVLYSQPPQLTFNNWWFCICKAEIPDRTGWMINNIQ